MTNIVKYNDNIDIKCACGRIFTTTFSRFLHGQKRRCDICTGKNFDIRSVKEYLEPFDVKVISTYYKNDRTELELICKCGELFLSKFSAIRHKNKVFCNKCTIGKIHTYWTQSEIDDYLLSVDLKALSPYIKDDEQMLLLCPCGENFSASFNKIKFSNKIRCNKCTRSQSKIEILAEKYLKSNNVDYITQYRFKDLKSDNNVPLKFDFAILDINKNISCLIELDGIQHFELVKKWGDIEGFKIRKVYDDMKNQYCQDNDIKLFRIPYWEFNQINNKLSNILNMTILCQASQ